MFVVTMSKLNFKTASSIIRISEHLWDRGWQLFVPGTIQKRYQ